MNMRRWMKKYEYREIPLALRKAWGCKCAQCLKIEGNENWHDGINGEMIGACEGNLKGWMLAIPRK